MRDCRASREIIVIWKIKQRGAVARAICNVAEKPARILSQRCGRSATFNAVWTADFFLGAAMRHSAAGWRSPASTGPQK
jgi:hypothetical protein